MRVNIWTNERYPDYSIEVVIDGDYEISNELYKECLTVAFRYQSLQNKLALIKEEQNVG